MMTGLGTKLTIVLSQANLSSNNTVLAGLIGVDVDYAQIKLQHNRFYQNNRHYYNKLPSDIQHKSRAKYLFKTNFSFKQKFLEFVSKQQQVYCRFDAKLVDDYQQVCRLLLQQILFVLAYQHNRVGPYQIEMHLDMKLRVRVDQNRLVDLLSNLDGVANVSVDFGNVSVHKSTRLLAYDLYQNQVLANKQALNYLMRHALVFLDAETKVLGGLRFYFNRNLAL